ncbi:hypothetical protein [Chitinilyticum litopenaei]|uniref:hypothetical protein n=1 Tax=Chitinilyticum litopenaei TaxID=1121276 RepID=UPI0004202D06|nr:hypothetical protein [Chitinilyticum litopenaei]
MTRNDQTAILTWLRRGHGRARRCLQQHGTAGLETQIVDACLRDTRHDRQCEASRAPWLAELLAEHPELISAVRPQLLAQLANWPAAEPDDDDVAPAPVQCVELAGELARAGDAVLADRLRAAAMACTLDWDWLTLHEEWVKLDGLPALIETVRRAGARLIAHPEDQAEAWPFLDSLQEDAGLDETAGSALRQAAKHDAALAAWLAFCKSQDTPAADTAGDAEDYKTRFLRKWPVERIIAQARQHAENYPSFYARFGRHASADGLRQVLQALLDSDDDEACLRLLWVFRRTPLPELPEKLLGWLDKEHQEIRAATRVALGQLQHPEVARQALSRLQATPQDYTLLPLFARNAAQLDSALLQLVLAALPIDDDDVAHDIASDLLELDADTHNAGVDHSASLHWIYEHSPCSICRGTAVERLHERQQLSHEQQAECRLDADDGIQKLFPPEPTINRT